MWRGKRWVLLGLFGLAACALARQAYRGPVLRVHLDFEARAGLRDVLDAGQLGAAVARKLGVGVQLVELANDASTTLDGLRGPMSFGITRVRSFALASRRRPYRALYALPNAKSHELLVLADRSRPVVWARALTTPSLQRVGELLLSTLGLESAQLTVRDVVHEPPPPAFPGDTRSFRWMEPLLQTLLDGQTDVVIVEAGRVSREALPAQLARLRVLARFRTLSSFLLVVPQEASPALLAALEQTLPPELARLRLDVEGDVGIRPALDALAALQLERTDEPFQP